MKKVILVALIVLLLTACGQTPTNSASQENLNDSDPQNSLDSEAEKSTDNLTWQEQYDLGLDHLAKGNYEAAIDAFEMAIELDSQQSKVYVARGDAYMSWGETEENLKMALNDYLKALSQNAEDPDIYLKIADIYIAQDEIDKLHQILDQASEKFGETAGISERRDSISPLKAGGISALLLSNAWDTSVQTTEYTFFFRNGRGLRLTPGDGWRSKEFSYTAENDRVLIIENLESSSMGSPYEDEWILENGDPQHFTWSIEEEEGIVSELWVTPVPGQDIFDTMVSLTDTMVYNDAFWSDFLNLVVLYKQSAMARSAADTYQLEQESWNTWMTQEIVGKGIDLDSSAGKAWMKYYTKCHIYDLLGLSTGDLEPPTETPPEPYSNPDSVEAQFAISEEQAKQIASDYWGGAPFAKDIDSENPTEYESYIVYLGTVEHQGKTYYSFSLKWWINAGEYLVPRTVEPLYIDAQMGDFMNMLP